MIGKESKTDRQIDRKERDMYLKIIRHLGDELGVSSRRGSLEDKVVPIEHHIFECTEARYRKTSVKRVAEFHDIINKMDVVRIITPVYDDLGEEEPFEFIQIHTVIKEDDDKYSWENLICRDCVLYVMNNEGKTIDSLVCR